MIRQRYGSFSPDSGLIIPRKGLLKPFWAAGSGDLACLLGCFIFFFGPGSGCASRWTGISEQPCYSEQSAADQQTVSIEPGAPRWIVSHFKQTSIGAVLFTPNLSGRLETSAW